MEFVIKLSNMSKMNPCKEIHHSLVFEPYMLILRNIYNNAMLLNDCVAVSSA